MRMGSGWLGPVAFLLQACTSYASYRFAPPLQEVELRTQDGSSAVARVLVSSRGIVEGERDGRDAYALAFRLRVENQGDVALVLDTGELQLVDARLATIGPARVEPAPELIEAGSQANYLLSFPLPDGKSPDDFDLSALNLRIALRGGDQLWTWSASFQLLPRDDYYHDPYWGPAWGVSFGVVWCD